MLGAVMFAHEASQEGLQGDHQARREGRQGSVGARHQRRQDRGQGQAQDLVGKDIDAAYKLTDKSERSTALNEARAKAKEAFAEADPQEQMAASKAVKSLEADIVRSAILKEGRRIDGRDTKTVRPIESDGRLPAAHPRLGAVHARRDPGDLHHHARHQGHPSR